MRINRKISKKLLLLFLIIGFLISQSKTIMAIFESHQVYAVGDLTVDWGIGGGNVGPIFTVPNMAPGNSQSRNVTIHNGSTTVRPIAIKGLKTNVSVLDSAFVISIKDGGTTLYSKSLNTFFAESSTPTGIHITDIVPGGTKILVITTLFQQSAGNTYQNKQLTFDLIFGIAVAIPAECQQIDLTGKFPIYGTAKNDVITGTPGNDVIFSLEGNDTVFGKGGNDCLIGGPGIDVLSGEAGNDTLMAGDGVDTINGGAGNDTLFGENGNDTILGEGGNDDANGGDGNDTIVGGAGTDTANGEAGRDTCVAETRTQCEL
jgi:Ca2+-binding RTX toxin-like protein